MPKIEIINTYPNLQKSPNKTLGTLGVKIRYPSTHKFLRFLNLSFEKVLVLRNLRLESPKIEVKTFFELYEL